MSETIENRKVEVVNNKEVYVGSEVTGLSETYEVEIVESSKKKVYVHCDPSENMTREDVVELISNHYAQGLITVEEDDSISDLTVR